MKYRADDGSAANGEPRRRKPLEEVGPAERGGGAPSRRGSDRVAALYAQIAERDRRIADLEARNGELERYAYTVSHDLKTPLVTIKGFISFLYRDVQAGDHERVQHDLERIGSAADRMKRLLDDLLELARVGRVGNKPRHVAFAEVVAEALERSADAIAKRGAQILVAPSLPEVYGDKSLLVDVLAKLLDNALRHTGTQPALVIEVGARRAGSRKPAFGAATEGSSAAGPAEAVLFVRDNGPGIHPRYHDQVFNLFERLDSGTSQGTGVGLTLVKRIIDFHGGKIWIESSGRGSTLCFTLPGTRTGSDSESTGRSAESVAASHRL